MNHEGRHVSPEDLLLAADGELAGSAAGAVRDHLSACWTCRSKADWMESAIREFVRAYQRLTADGVPSIEGPLALLRARLGGSASH